MPSNVPRVSVGLPVYNGEKFLAQAIESILCQTYPDLELVLSDNASTDRTQQICESFAARDYRVRYHRSPMNIGASRNHNRVVELSRGEIFLWASHDDLFTPEYVSRCLQVMDGHPEILLCYSLSGDVDEYGHSLDADNPHRVRAVSEDRLATSSTRPSNRFREMIRLDHQCEAMYGLVRAPILKATSMHGHYADADRVLLAELSLRGPFHVLPDRLFFHREHPDRSVNLHGSRQERSVWMDPSKAGKLTLPHVRQFWELMWIVHRASLPVAEAARCYLHLARWFVHYRKRIWNDLTSVTRLGAKRLLFHFHHPEVTGGG